MVAYVSLATGVDSGGAQVAPPSTFGLANGESFRGGGGPVTGASVLLTGMSVTAGPGHVVALVCELLAHLTGWWSHFVNDGVSAESCSHRSPAQSMGVV